MGRQAALQGGKPGSNRGDVAMLQGVEMMMMGQPICAIRPVAPHAGAQQCTCASRGSLSHSQRLQREMSGG